MIAPDHQGKGYGRAALGEAVAMAKASPYIDMMHLDYVPGNEIARKLYYSVGFRENGDVEDGEIIMTLPLTDTPSLGSLVADSDDTEEILSLLNNEKAAGNPAAAVSASVLGKAVENGEVRRFTLMGETVGISFNGVLLFDSEHMEYISEAEKINL